MTDMEDDFQGAVKIFDGLYLGDKDSSQDIDLITLNKVTHIINAASGEIKNEWVQTGVKYLNFDLQDNKEQLESSQTAEDFLSCCEFIDSCLQAHESVLVHSVKRDSQSISIILCYLMHKFNWTLSKCLEFLNSRLPNCKIQQIFLTKLIDFEKSLTEKLGVIFSKTWESQKNLDEEVLSNTFLNSKPGEFVKLVCSKKKRKKKIRWVEGLIEIKRSASRKSAKSCFSSKLESKPKNKEQKKLKPCIKGKENVLENNLKSLNTFIIKKDGESLKTRQVRNNSASKFENSSFFKEIKRNVKVKKGITASAILTLERLKARPSSGRVISECLGKGKSLLRLNCRR